MARSRAPHARTTVVVVTRDRREGLLHALDQLTGLPEQPPVVVLDNGSSDGTPEAVSSSFPDVRTVPLGRNLGATARNVGVALAETPHVAFADDDSWWAPGALDRAADHLDAHPRLAVLQGRILVGPDERLDPTCAAMACSPLPRAHDLPGPSILGFVACGAVVRRDAFLAAGGFDDVLFFLGEEQLLAQDLAATGWGLAYVDDVVAHHHPSPARDPAARRRQQLRNDLLATWMRRRWRVVAACTADIGTRALRDAAARAAAREALRRLPAALARRRPLPREVERQLSLLDGG